MRSDHLGCHNETSLSAHNWWRKSIVSHRLFWLRDCVQQPWLPVSWPLSTILLSVLFPSSSPCSNMIRFTGMSKWVILFIHCSCLDPSITRRIKASESQQEVKREKKGNLVFYFYSASMLVFISVVTADSISIAAHSSVVDLTLHIFPLVLALQPCVYGCACTVYVQCVWVFKRERVKENPSGVQVLYTGWCYFSTVQVWQSHFRCNSDFWNPYHWSNI